MNPTNIRMHRGYCIDKLPCMSTIEVYLVVTCTRHGLRCKMLDLPYLAERSENHKKYYLCKKTNHRLST